MTDPFKCCYIWCAMDPINKNPQSMLALIYQHQPDPSWVFNQQLTGGDWKPWNSFPETLGNGILIPTDELNQTRIADFSPKKNWEFQLLKLGPLDVEWFSPAFLILQWCYQQNLRTLLLRFGFKQHKLEFNWLSQLKWFARFSHQIDELNRNIYI